MLRQKRVFPAFHRVIVLHLRPKGQEQMMTNIEILQTHAMDFINIVPRMVCLSGDLKTIIPLLRGAVGDFWLFMQVAWSSNLKISGPKAKPYTLHCKQMWSLTQGTSSSLHSLTALSLLVTSRQDLAEPYKVFSYTCIRCTSIVQGDN